MCSRSEYPLSAYRSWSHSTGYATFSPPFPFYEDECRYMLKYLVNERGYRKLYIAYADNAYGYLFRDALRAGGAALGYEVVSEQAVVDMNQRP